MTAAPNAVSVEDALPEDRRGNVVAIGNFDGLHLGHRRLIDQARAMADEMACRAAVLTFDPHPRAFFRPDVPMFRLLSWPLKVDLFRYFGIHEIFVTRFDKTVADLTAPNFVNDIIVGRLGASAVVVGEDFHFGRGREGTPAVLSELARQHGIDCALVAPVRLAGAVVSSSSIRAALEQGEIGAANGLLGYRWLVEGEVIHGQKRGRTLGYPTANIALDESCRLAHGIYAVRVRLASGAICGGVASFGRRPTFDNGPPLLETFLFDFAGDLYGQTMRVEFVGWIRGEARFDSVDALVAQMERDAEEARTVLRRDDGLSSVLGGEAEPKLPRPPLGC